MVNGSAFLKMSSAWKQFVVQFCIEQVLLEEPIIYMNNIPVMNSAVS